MSTGEQNSAVETGGFAMQVLFGSQQKKSLIKVPQYSLKDDSNVLQDAPKMPSGTLNLKDPPKPFKEHSTLRIHPSPLRIPKLPVKTMLDFCTPSTEPF